MDPHSARDVGEAKKHAKAEAAEQDEFLRTMLSTRQGRKWFWNLLARCGVQRNPFATDPLTMAFSAGEMNIGQMILADIVRVAPAQYIAMMGEVNGPDAEFRNSDTGPSPGSDTGTGSSADGDSGSDRYEPGST